MGVSSQCHRISIGTFCPGQIQRKIRCVVVSKKSMSSFKFNFLLSFLALGSLLIAHSPNFQVSRRSSSPSVHLKPVLLSPVQPRVITKCTVLRGDKFNSCRNEYLRSPREPQLIVIKKICLLTDVNFYARYTNGNRSNRGLKICHWNMGSAHLENKTNEIETVLADLRPHVLGISESNIFRWHNIENVMMEDYELFTSTTLENPNLEVSRVVVYKHKSIIAKVRKDLMDDNFSFIWMEMGLPNKRKILVCNFYREHQYMRQADNSSLAGIEH